jgi:hypothetical protein
MADVARGAQDELATALSCLPLDVEGAVVHLSAAVRGFTEGGDDRGAGIACARLGDVYASFMGNRTAARAWYARADRHVADLPSCVEQGWVAVASMGCEVDDPDVLLARAELALSRAREFGDVDLEIKALADSGLAHVEAGRVDEGMALLDESMALVIARRSQSPAGMTMLGQSVCSFFTACYFSGDFERAEAWREPLRRNGLIGAVPGIPVFLSSHCDSIQAALLCELGRWHEAEAVLVRAIGQFESLMTAPAWHPAVALADLRVRQGRLAEAESLLVGKDSSPQALLPAARMHLARGEHELARASARRGLRTMKNDCLRTIDLLTVIVQASLSAGDVEGALGAVTELEARNQALDLPAVNARSQAMRARVLAASGDTRTAIAVLEPAVDSLAVATAPWLQATMLVELAALREQTGDRAGAIVEAKAAAAILANLDALLTATETATLQRLLGDGPASVAADRAVLSHQDKWWSASHQGTTVRLADTKGMRYLATLVARPGSERHAFDLVDMVEGIGPVDRRHLGDAGELADSRARREYRKKTEQLRADIEDAFEVGALDRAEILQSELDGIVTQLAQAFGIGGAARPASSAAERARLNVTRAIRSATSRLAAALPDAGTALDRAIRTGHYCAYLPGEEEIRWIVQS